MCEATHLSTHVGMSPHTRRTYMGMSLNTSLLCTYVGMSLPTDLDNVPEPNPLQITISTYFF